MPSVDYFSYCVENFLIKCLNPELLEEKALLKMQDFMSQKIFVDTVLSKFNGGDYQNPNTLHMFLTVLLNDSIKKIAEISKNPIFYLRSLFDWPSVINIYLEYIGLLEREEEFKADYIFFIHQLVQFLYDPWNQEKILAFKLTLEDLVNQTPILEKIDMKSIKIGHKNTLDEICRAMLRSPDIRKLLEKMSGKISATFEKELLPLLDNYDQYYMLKADSHLGPTCDYTWGRLLPTGMIVLHEVSLPIADKKKNQQLALAKAALTILHERANYIKYFLRDGGLVFPCISSEEEASEFDLEKTLFSRYNTLHLLVDTRPSNRPIINKMAKHILQPENWLEDDFCYQIKNMILQIHCKETIGFDTLNPTFKRKKIDYEADEPVIIMKEPLSKQSLISTGGEIITKKEEFQFIAI